MYELTILIPIYNEAENIQRLGKELNAYLTQASKRTSVLLINDGSSDESQSGIENICEKYKDFNYITLAQNGGLSTALKAGIDQVRSPLIGYMDADLQTTPQDFETLLPYLNDYDLVNGVRVDREDSGIKKLSSTIANKIRRSFTGDGMDDTGCPLKIIRAEYAKNIPMFRGLHRFLPAMILLQNGRVIQVPVRHFPRTAGTPKYGLLNRIWGPLIDCFAFLWMKRKYIRYEIKAKG
ncbi:glycosyltransferase [Membranicola marinus]|uniref:Glycosyltransferase n=1 Tax=Membranihabitans marinus TaxID=1227546 RepID=A0A953HW73_9BACT|nr:glycosyltransferase [Membranihabitans marinus]MBY5958938.1 glycosyltransferase [Membranihabitans marinus]